MTHHYGEVHIKVTCNVCETYRTFSPGHTSHTLQRWAMSVLAARESWSFGPGTYVICYNCQLHLALRSLSTAS